MARSSRPDRAPEPSDQDAPAPAADGLEGLLQAHLAKTPWWAISVVFHAVVLGLLATITFAHQVVFEEPTIVILRGAERQERLEEAERPRGVFTQDGVPTPDPSAEAPPVFFPDAEPSDRVTTDDDVDDDTAFGLDERFQATVGDSPGVQGRLTHGPAGRSGAIGAGGPAGTSGAFGDGRGSRKRGARPPGGPTTLTESAVEAGLRWLARHQGEDGGWSCDGFSARCAGGRCSGGGGHEYDVGVSGLSLLAFLGAGYTHLTRTTYVDLPTKQRLSFGKTVRRGLEWLAGRQTSDGCVGPKVGHYMYNHAIAALALAEAYGLTNAAAYKEPAQRAIDFLVEAQNPGLGWRYSSRCGDNDTSVTGWAVMALKSAHVSGLAVPRASFDGAKAWLQRVTEPSGAVGYTALGTTDVFVPGKNDAWRGHPSMTAIGLLLRVYIDANQGDPLHPKSARLLVADLPVWDAAKREVDAYYWYYATLALFQYQEDGSWKRWNVAMKNALVPSQRVRKDGCQDGSWDPEVDRWGFSGGRIYVTALNVMSLEVYYRYGRVFEQKPH